MNNILTSFLKALHVKYTSDYAEKLYEEHPHKYNLYGLSKMLEEYGIANAGVRINDKNIHSLETPKNSSKDYGVVWYSLLKRMKIP